MSVGRTSLLLAPLALLARGVAFFVPVVLAAWFGVSAEMDAFFYALNIPTFFLVLGAGALATVVVPTLAELTAAEPEERGRFVGAAALWSAVGSLAVGVVIGGLLPTMLSWSTFDPTTRAAATGFYWALMPSLTLNAVNAVIKAACEVGGRFSAAALSPIVRTVILVALAGLWRAEGPSCLPAALASGLAGETLWLGAVLAGAGVRVRPSLSIPPSLTRTAQALLPVLVGETLVALNVVTDKQFASGLPAGSVSLLEYADRARLIPQTLLESTLMVVAFNAWSHARARGEAGERHTAVARALWWVAVLAPPMLGGMIVGRYALVAALFEHGAFSEASSGATADILGAFLPGVYCSLLAALAVKAHVVAGRYRLVMALGLLSFFLNAAADAVFVTPFGLVGLASATTVTNLAVIIVALRGLWPEIGDRWTRARATSLAVSVLGTATLIGAIHAGGLEPRSIADPQLWLLALPFCALLAWGAAQVRRDLA